MAKELAKQYDPKGTEDRIYQEWCDKGYFHTQIDRSKKQMCIRDSHNCICCTVRLSVRPGQKGRIYHRPASSKNRAAYFRPCDSGVRYKRDSNDAQ